MRQTETTSRLETRGYLERRGSSMGSTDETLRAERT
jgi:hypothetical protein